MSTAQVALGSNLGDPQAMIERALAELGRFGMVLARSGLYRTPALGPPQPEYLNAAATLETTLEPEGLLEGLKALEVELGRAPLQRRWGPRLIDLDLLFVDDRVLSTPRLTLPHPEVQLRSFVLVPLVEIAPRWRHPLLGRTIAELRDARPATELAAIRRLDSARSAR